MLTLRTLCEIAGAVILTKIAYRLGELRGRRSLGETLRRMSSRVANEL